uniref:Uncharacterized protein n=1 Tax=Cucumis sativus TaxID=3659 RepID=A0A0A0KHJ3_CUCSA
MVVQGSQSDSELNNMTISLSLPSHLPANLYILKVISGYKMRRSLLKHKLD